MRAVRFAGLIVLCLGLGWGCRAGEKVTRCRVTPESLDYGPVVLGDAVEKTLQVANDGDTPLEITFLLPDGEFRFPDGDTLVVSLSPGESAAIPVQFAPAAVGNRETLVELRGAPCSGVRCTGRGEQEECRVEPGALDFGRVRVGESVQGTFTVRNLGTVSLVGVVAMACPGYRVFSGGGPFVLVPGDSLRVTVEFAPEGVGSQSCTVDLGSGLCAGVSCTGDAKQTWDVFMNGSGDAPTIQAAIDGAGPGDLVLVHPGTYYENINLLGKSIHVKSEAGPGMTIVDGSRKDDAVVRCQSGEGNDTIVEGFTLRGGSREAPEGEDAIGGGGIVILRAQPTIQGNVIESNAAEYQGGGAPAGIGGGILCQADQPGETWRPRILKNVIRDNRAGLHGGGIALVNFVSARIEDNVIEENEAVHGDGGGLWIGVVVDGSTVFRNVVAGNSAWNHGGGICGAGASGVVAFDIRENVISANRARGEGGTLAPGGAIWIRDVQGTVERNTIVRNRGTRPFPCGGLAIYGAGPEIVSRNIIVSSEHGGVFCAPEAMVSIENNIVWDDYLQGGCQDQLGRDGNVYADPLFCDIGAGDLRVSLSSPAMLHPAAPIGALGKPGCAARPGVRYQRDRR